MLIYHKTGLKASQKNFGAHVALVVLLPVTKFAKLVCATQSLPGTAGLQLIIVDPYTSTCIVR